MTESNITAPTRLPVLLLALSVVTTAGAWSDINGNKIDDVIETVNANGWAAAFENNNPALRLRIGAFDLPTGIEYAVYVGYDHHPTAIDETALVAVVGLTAPMKTYSAIDYTRTQADFSEIASIASLPGVTRVESIPMMYPTNHIGSRVVRARDSRGLKSSENYQLFPSAQEELGLDGTGVTVAILDTGVNDEPDGITAYPGHESLAGKFVGGGEFFAGNPSLNTPQDQSVNPKDRGPEGWHGTHVAGSAIGTGGQDGFFAGVAPAARLVDCKVLSDAGVGFGSADGVDWCIANLNNDWGLTGDDRIYAGIDVISMSLGCLDCSGDGTTADELIIDAAVNAGLIVCIATGNDDAVNQISSPASADLSVAVGAATHAATLTRSDDLVTDFSNEGPRASDGDADQLDEYKPSVVAPGAGTVSANGDPFSSQGQSYSTKSGTSMSTPHVSGVCALLKQADPTLTGTEARTILQNTAIHHIPSAKGDRPYDPFGLDPNYDPMSGWGEVDAYAAAKEVLNSTSGVQVVQIRAQARPDDGAIDVFWWTQREYSFDGFNVHRAPDLGGAPGSFTQLNGAPIAGTGDPVIEADDNREAYVYVDGDPSLVLGQTYWYQIEWVDGSSGNLEPPVPAEFGNQPLVATIFYSLQHNTPDNDLFVKLGTSGVYDPTTPDYFTLGEGSGRADDSVVHEPANAATATIGYIEWFWSRGFTVADGIAAFLPPSQGHPWFVNVADAGYVNRTGSHTGFSIFVNDFPGSSGGTTYVTDSLNPMPMIDQILAPGYTSTQWIPEQGAVSVAISQLRAEGLEGRIRVEMELADPTASATALISRAQTREFVERAFLSDSGVVGGLLRYDDDTVLPGVEYWYWIETRFADGSTVMSGPVHAKASGSSLTYFSPPRPNPVSGPSIFSFNIGADTAGDGEVPVQLTLHDLRGRLIRTLEAGPRGIGRYWVTWDGTDDGARSVARGIYVVRLAAGGHRSTTKVVVMQ